MFLPWKQLGRVDGHFLAAHDVADFDEGAAVGQHIDAFPQQVGPAHQLHHHVGAAAPGQLTDPTDAGFGSVELLDVDGMVGAEFLSQLETVLQTVQDDDAIRAALLGHGGGVEAQTAGADDDDGLAVAHVGPLQAGGHGAHGAVDRAEQVVGQFVGDAEEGMSWRQVEEVAIGAGEVGPVAGGGILTVGAPVGRSAEDTYGSGSRGRRRRTPRGRLP